MEMFAALLAVCAGNSPVTSEFPAQRPVARNFKVFFDLHLRRHCTHYAVTVMYKDYNIGINPLMIKK